MPNQSLQEMFVLGVPVIEKIIRSIIVYIFLVVSLRLAGRRELSQLNTFDLVVLFLLSNTVQNAIIGNDNSLTGGLLGAAVLLLINHFLVRFLYQHERIDEALEGKTVPLVMNGVLLRANLIHETITEAELVAAIHRQGFEHLADVQEVFLETNGAITVIGRSPSAEEARGSEILERLARIENLLAQKG